MSRIVINYVLLAAAGLLLGYAGSCWLHPVSSQVMTESARRWELPTDPELLLAASEGEMVLAPMLAEASADALQSVAKTFAALPAKDARAETGLFVSLIYWARQDAHTALTAIFSWPDLKLKPAAVHGAFFGARNVTEIELLDWLEKARLAQCITPAVKGASEVQPRAVLSYLEANEINLTGPPNLHWHSWDDCGRRFSFDHAFANLREVAFTAWAKQEPQAAFAAAQIHPAWQYSLRGPMMEMFCHRYPELMIDLWQDYVMMRKGGLQTTLWLQRLPLVKALEIVKTQPALLRDVTNLLAEWASVDFAAAATWARTVAPALQAAALSGLLDGGSPNELWVFADTISSRSQRLKFQESLLERIVLKDPAQALQKLRWLPEESRSAFVYRNLRFLLEHDDKALATYLGDHPETKLDVSVGCLLTWPAEITERLLNLLPDTPENANKILQVKSESILTSNLSAVEAYEKLLALHHDQAAAASVLLRRWLNLSKKSTEVMHWLETQSLALQNRILPKLIDSIGALGIESPDTLFPRLAAEFHQLEPNKAHDAKLAMDRIVLDLSRKRSPTSLIKWTEALPANSVTEYAKFSTFSVLMNTDPIAACAWVRTWPQGKQKDQAAVSIVVSTAADDPDAAMKWLQVIRDSRSRDDCIARTIATFAKDNSSKIRLWMGQISDPQVRARLSDSLATTD